MAAPLHIFLILSDFGFQPLTLNFLRSCEGKKYLVKPGVSTNFASREKNNDFKQDWSERLLLLKICFTAERTLPQLRKSWLIMTTYLNW